MDKARILANNSLHYVLEEKEFLSSIGHDFIVNMVAAFQDRQNLYLLMDYVECGDLRYYLKRKHEFGEESVSTSACMQSSW